VKARRDILLGIVGVITLLVFVWGINFLKGKDLLSRQNKFYVVYPSVDGLIESHPVTVNGVSIGQVNKIRFHPDRSGRVLVECIIRDHIDIPDNSVARLTASSIIGGHEIVLLLGDNMEYIQSGDTLLGSIQPALQDEITKRLYPFTDQAGIILLRLDTLLGSLNTFFNPEIRGSVASSLTEVNKNLQNINAITSNLERQEEKINHIINNLSSLTDTLAALEINSAIQTAAESIASLRQMLQSVNEGEGSIGMLLNDESLYRNLEQSSRQLELLLEDIRNNPGKYFSITVFGRSK